MPSSALVSPEVRALTTAWLAAGAVHHHALAPGEHVAAATLRPASRHGRGRSGCRVRHGRAPGPCRRRSPRSAPSDRSMPRAAIRPPASMPVSSRGSNAPARPISSKTTVRSNPAPPKPPSSSEKSAPITPISARPDQSVSLMAFLGFGRRLQQLRRHRVAQVAPKAVLQHLALFGQLEIHVSSLSFPAAGHSSRIALVMIARCISFEPP